MSTTKKVAPRRIARQALLNPFSLAKFPTHNNDLTEEMTPLPRSLKDANVSSRLRNGRRRWWSRAALPAAAARPPRRRRCIPLLDKGIHYGNNRGRKS